MPTLPLVLYLRTLLALPFAKRSARPRPSLVGRCLSDQATSLILLSSAGAQLTCLSAQEALRLAETYTGASCPHRIVGPAKNFRCSPATYFGSGTVAQLAELTAQLNVDRSAVAGAASTLLLLLQTTAKLHLLPKSCCLCTAYVG